MPHPLPCTHACVHAHELGHTHTHKHSHLQLGLDGIVKNKLQVQLQGGVEFQELFVTIYI